MISAIVYGRNDNHGYGMAKRVAIGLNVMAGQVDKGAGELLFVDYNTPDHLPTLPELIRDTLTAQCRKRLRVLRVRPAHHARFRMLSPLPVIESVARNVALRRSDPANRWVLATNTDAMVAPTAGRMLADAVAELEDGLYGLPRFELPERCWEGFDRLDPDGCVAAAREWSDRCRLAEVVRGVADVMFDNPGDFQLAPRAELFAIGGFEEEMLLGWHIDHNIARRLSFRLGGVRDLSDRFDLYHLGHSRNVVATHARGKVENDIPTFVNALESAQAMHDPDGWGMAQEEIEEIRLETPTAARVLDACAAIMPPLDGERQEAAYLPESFNTFDYDAGRATAHLVDLLSPFHPSTRVVWSGGRRTMLALLRDGLAALGFRDRLLVPQSVADRLGPATLGDVEVAGDDDAFAAADVLVFEFGRDAAPAAGPYAGRELSTEDAAWLDAVAMLLDRAVTAERERAGSRPPRLFVAVNVVHTRFETFVGERIAAGLSPFTTRLRYGFAADLPAAGPAAHPEVVVHAWLLLRRIAAGDSLSPHQRLEVAAHAELIRALVADPPEGFETLRGDDALASRLDEILRPGAEIARVATRAAPTAPPLSGPARGDAWRDRHWASLARSFSKVRNGWTWERAQILHGLSAMPEEGGEGRVLVVCDHPDPVVDALASRFPLLDVMDVCTLSGEVSRFETPEAFASGPLPAGTARLVTSLTAAPGAYGAIVLPHAAGFRHGVAALGGLAARLAGLLAPGGVLVLASEVSLLGGRSGARPAFHSAGTEGFPALLDRFLGLRLVDGGAPALRADDLASVGGRDLLDSDAPVLGVAEDGDILWPWVWVFSRSGEEPGAVDSAALDAAFAGLLLGEQIDRLSLGNGAKRRDGRIDAREPHGAGHVVYGPFLNLTPGNYRARFRFADIVAPADMAGEGRLVVEVSVGPSIEAQETIYVSPDEAAPREVELDFAVLSAEPAPIETRVWTDGQVGLVLESLSILPG